MRYLLLFAFLFPTFTAAPPLREVADLGPVLTDVESHLNPGHPYRDADRLTWIHEGTHGINGLLRNKHGCPAFYVLKNRCVLLKEPATTLSTVAATVPPSLRGKVYHLYLIQMQRYWQTEPSYCFDEWVAYTNTADAALQRNTSDRGATQFAIEFCVYSTCVPMAAKDNDQQMKSFLTWQFERTLNINRGHPSAYLETLKTSKDAETLRTFMRGYYGPAWTLNKLGF